LIDTNRKRQKKTACACTQRIRPTLAYPGSAQAQKLGKQIIRGGKHIAEQSGYGRGRHQQPGEQKQTAAAAHVQDFRQYPGAEPGKNQANQPVKQGAGAIRRAEEAREQGTKHPQEPAPGGIGGANGEKVVDIVVKCNYIGQGKAVGCQTKQERIEQRPGKTLLLIGSIHCSS